MVQGLWITYKFYRKVVSSNVNNYNKILNTKNLEFIILPYKKAYKKVYSKGRGEGEDQAHSELVPKDNAFECISLVKNV